MWKGGKGAEPQGECHATAVASKKEAHAIYADLVSKVVSKSTRKYPNKQLPVQRTKEEVGQQEWRAFMGGQTSPMGGGK